MRKLETQETEELSGGGCDGVDYWLGVSTGFTVAAGLATAGFGFVAGVVVTGILASESAACHGVSVSYNRRR